MRWKGGAKRERHRSGNRVHEGLPFGAGFRDGASPQNGKAAEPLTDAPPSSLFSQIYNNFKFFNGLLKDLTVENQKLVLIEYKGFTWEKTLRFDLLVENCVLIEVKELEKVAPTHKDNF